VICKYPKNLTGGGSGSSSSSALPIWCSGETERAYGCGVTVESIAPDIAFADFFIIPNEELDLGDLLGRGGYGLVFHGIWKREVPLLEVEGVEEATPEEGGTHEVVIEKRQVAVKKLLVGEDEEFNVTEFQTEAWMARYPLFVFPRIFPYLDIIKSLLQHENLVRFEGICLRPPMLVTEFVQNGDLRKLLDRTPYPRRSPEEEKQWRAKIMQILIDVAKGMLYMHSFTPAIIHRYLRSFLFCYVTYLRLIPS